MYIDFHYNNPRFSETNSNHVLSAQNEEGLQYDQYLSVSPLKTHKVVYCWETESYRPSHWSELTPAPTNRIRVHYFFVFLSRFSIRRNSPNYVSLRPKTEVFTPSRPKTDVLSYHEHGPDFDANGIYSVGIIVGNPKALPGSLVLLR